MSKYLSDISVTTLRVGLEKVTGLTSGTLLVSGNVTSAGTSGFKVTGTGASVYGFRSIETWSAASPNFFGVDIEPTITASSGSANFYGVYGAAQFSSADALTGHILYGLNFAATTTHAGSASNTYTTATLYGGFAQVIAANGTSAASGATKQITVTDATGFGVALTFTAAASTGGTGNIIITAGAGFKVNAPTFGATATGTRSVAVTNLYGLRITGLALSNTRVTVTNNYGIKVEDFTGTTFTASTINALLWLGGTTPYLKVLGNFTAAANVTPVYISEGAGPNSYQIKSVVETAVNVATGTKRLLYVE